MPDPPLVVPAGAGQCSHQSWAHLAPGQPGVSAPNTTPWLSLRLGDAPRAPARAELAAARRSKWLSKALSRLAGLWWHRHLPRQLQTVPTTPSGERCPPGVFPRRPQSSTPVLGDGSARSWGRASRQSVLVAGLARGHQSQHRSAARDVLGSETHQGGERHRKEGGGRAKQPRGGMGRVFQHQSHAVAQPRQSHAGRVPQDGAMGQVPATTTMPHPPTSKHCYQGELGRVVGKLRHGSGGQGAAGEPCPTPGQPRLPLTQPDVEGRC